MSARREVEAKLVIPAPHAARIASDLIDAPAIGPLDAEPARFIELRDVYLDTPGRALAQWGGAMRIRTQNGTTLLTIKGPAGDRSGPAISRPELEVPLNPPNVDHAITWLRDLIDDPRDVPDAGRIDPPVIEGFLPIHDRATARAVRIVSTPAGSVEMAVDRACYQIDGAQVTLVEIEVEATDETDLEGVVAGVDAVRAQCAPFTPRAWSHSKLAVGLALERLGDMTGLTDDGILTAAGLDRVHNALSDR